MLLCQRLPAKGAPARAGEGLFFILDHYLIALENSRKRHKSSCPLFSLTQKVQREKLSNEKHRKRISLVATSDQGSAFGNRDLFEKRSIKNFQ